MIKNLPINENPREKALTYGIETLSNAELLAIVLRTGTKDESVLMLSQRLLKEIGGIEQLYNVNYSQLTSLKGIKKAKAIEILSIIEFAKRLKKKDVSNEQMLSPKNIFLYMKDQMMFLKQEHFVVLCLDNGYRVIKKKVIFIGSINMSVVTPREVFKEAINVSSAKIALLHNHPSGDANPSIEDVKLTQHFMKLGDMLDICVIDHIIIGWNQYYSLKSKRIFHYKEEE